MTRSFQRDEAVADLPFVSRSSFVLWSRLSAELTVTCPWMEPTCGPVCSQEGERWPRGQVEVLHLLTCHLLCPAPPAPPPQFALLPDDAVGMDLEREGFRAVQLAAAVAGLQGVC